MERMIQMQGRSHEDPLREVAALQYLSRSGHCNVQQCVEVRLSSFCGCLSMFVCFTCGNPSCFSLLTNFSIPTSNIALLRYVRYFQSFASSFAASAVCHIGQQIANDTSVFVALYPLGVCTLIRTA